MSKGIRYKDGTLMMPGSKGHELATEANRAKPIAREKLLKELDAHMAEVHTRWCKERGVKDVKNTTA